MAAIASSAEEEGIVARARTGDAQAFDQLVSRYGDRLYNLCLRLLGHPEDASDVAQAAFVRAYVSLSEFGGRASFGTWLYRIAVNCCLDHLKRRRRRPEVALTEEIPADLDDPNERLAARDRQRLVRAAIRELPKHQRAVLVLYDLQGLSYEEIAVVIGANVGTVKSRLNRARLALRDKLRPYMELLRT